MTCNFHSAEAAWRCISWDGAVHQDRLPGADPKFYTFGDTPSTVPLTSRFKRSPRFPFIHGRFELKVSATRFNWRPLNTDHATSSLDAKTSARLDSTGAPHTARIPLKRRAGSLWQLSQPPIPLGTHLRPILDTQPKNFSMILNSRGVLNITSISQQRIEALLQRCVPEGPGRV